MSSNNAAFQAFPTPHSRTYTTNTVISLNSSNGGPGNYFILPASSASTTSISTISASTATANGTSTASSNSSVVVPSRSDRTLTFGHLQNNTEDSLELPTSVIDSHSISSSGFSIDKSTSAKSLLLSQSIKYLNDINEDTASIHDFTNNSSNSNTSSVSVSHTANTAFINGLLNSSIVNGSSPHPSIVDKNPFNDSDDHIGVLSSSRMNGHTKQRSKVISRKKSLINNKSISYSSSSDINPLNSSPQSPSLSKNKSTNSLNAHKHSSSISSLGFPSDRISQIFNITSSSSLRQSINIPNSSNFIKIQRNTNSSPPYDTFLYSSASPTTVLNPNSGQNGSEFEQPEQYSQFPRELTTVVPVRQIPPSLTSKGMVVHDRGIIDEFGEISEFRSPAVPSFELEDNDRGDIIDDDNSCMKNERPQPMRKTQSVQLLEKYSRFSLDNCKAEQDLQLYQWESFLMSVALRKHPNLQKFSKKTKNSNKKSKYNRLNVSSFDSGVRISDSDSNSKAGSNLTNGSTSDKTVHENTDYSLFNNYDDLIGFNASKLSSEELKQLRSLLVCKNKRLPSLSTPSNATSKMANLLLITSNHGKSPSNSSNKISDTRNGNCQKWYTFGIPMKLRAKIWLAFAGLSIGTRSTEYEELINGAHKEDKNMNDEERQELSQLVKINERQIGLDYGRTMGNNVYFHDICKSNEKLPDLEQANQNDDNKSDENNEETEEIISPGSRRLRDLLIAFVRKHPKLGYCQGMNLIAANLILIFLDQSATYLFFEDLIVNRLNTRVFSIDISVIQKYVSLLFDKLMKKMVPKMYNAILCCGIDLQIHFVNWYITLFENIFPTKILFQVWDYLFCYPDDDLYEKNEQPINSRALSIDLKFFRIIITVFAYFQDTLSKEELSDTEQMNSFLVRLKGYVVAQNFTSFKLWELHRKLFKNNNDLITMKVLRQILQY